MESINVPVMKVISYDKYTPEKLMTMLDKDKLEELEEEFEQHPDGIELINFVWLMKNTLQVDKQDELFSDIDINGDLHMEWTEFTQYIIDTVMKNSTNSVETSKFEQILPEMGANLGSKKLTLLDLSNYSIFKRYFQSTKAIKIIYQKFIKQSIFCEKLNSVALLENYSTQVRFYSSEFEPQTYLKMPFEIKAFIMSIGYSNKLNTLAIT